MSKLTKAEAKAHRAACEVLRKDVLTLDEKWFVVGNWQESASHVNSEAGAFFTPAGLANDFAIEIGDCKRVIDLCAGIGGLSFAYFSGHFFQNGAPEIVCVEKNPGYIEVGRKLLPEALWIEADVFDANNMGLGRFDVAISNPPFGSTGRGGKGSPRFTGTNFEYHVIDIASDLADYGVFIIPQMSAPFRYSGVQYYQDQPSEKYDKFRNQTGIELTAGCGIDTSLFRRDWHGVAPATEIVCADFEAARASRSSTVADIASTPKPFQADLFAALEAS